MTALLALALASWASPASAEIKAGEWMASAGIGGGLPLGDINAAENADIDPDGHADLLRFDQKAAAGGLSGFAQVVYHIAPALAVGADCQLTGFGTLDKSVRLDGVRTTAVPAGLPQGAQGTFETEGTLIQVLGIARYVFIPDRALNPYLLGGAGVDSFSLSSKFQPSGTLTWFDSGTQEQRQLFNRSDTGFAASLGGGFQYAVEGKLLAGVEGRWNFSRTYDHKVGTGSVNSASAYAWAGWKFGGD